MHHKNAKNRWNGKYSIIFAGSVYIHESHESRFRLRNLAVSIAMTFTNHSMYFD